MAYISVEEAAVKWGVSTRQVQRLLADNRIPDAKKYGRAWMIPADAAKPVDARREKLEQKTPQQGLTEDLHALLAATVGPMPAGNPDGILAIAGEERVRRQYEAELAYLRGDFKLALLCYQEAQKDEAAKLRASLVAVAAAISLGDYEEYIKIETYLKSRMNNGFDRDISAIAELALASAAVSALAPNMVPGWLKQGDFSAFLPWAKPQFMQYLLYLRAKYLLCVGQYENAYTVAQTALAFSAGAQGITYADIYLRIAYALASHFLGREDEAGRILREAMGAALPHGFITPFAEPVSDFGGLIEKCLLQTYPACYDNLITQWQNTVHNWLSFHSRFTRNNVQRILTRREFYLAQMVARHIPYADIAKQYGISVGRLKNIMLEIYEKLCISGRDELAQFILYKKQ